jgi:hypothetical protein
MLRLVRMGDQGFEQLWNCLLQGVDCLDALYGRVSLEFYREYCGSSDVDDLSFVVVEYARPLCGVRAFRHILKGGVVEISCFGLPLLFVEQQKAPAIDLARAQRLLQKDIELLLQRQPIGTIIRYRDRLHGGRLSSLCRFLLDQGGKASPSFSQVIDLSLSEDALHRGLTKSYKWAVNWGKKNLAINILNKNSITSVHIEQFRQLHIESAGRETRTQKSWTLQYNMVCAGEAFCVFAFSEGKLVSAALFPYSRSHCFYGVSASCRDLFDKPISHGVIWVAVLYAKTLGLRYFEMGEQLFPMTPRTSPSQKELGISFFKRAFGGESLVFLDVHLQKNGGVEPSPLE